MCQLRFGACAAPGAAPPTAARRPPSEEIIFLLRVRRAGTKELRRPETMIREDILQKFPDLFGTKKVNGREVNIEQPIATLTRELEPEIAAALTARRARLHSPAPVSEKYAWPKWDETFVDPINGQPWAFRQILQGLIDNFRRRGRKWRGR